MKTIAIINQRIKEKNVSVYSAEEVGKVIEELGPEKALKEIDVVTSATFGAMCSSGAFFNFGHTDPPIKMDRLWLNDVPAYGGVAAVDAYLGATAQSLDRKMEYGGAHVLEDFVRGKSIGLRAESEGSDCYPRKSMESEFDKGSVNEAFLFNPRNAYQNYAAAANTSKKAIYTYMGKLLPDLGNVTYATTGKLSPLMNDPLFETIGIGTRIMMGGAPGFVAWHGTQFRTQVERRNGIPAIPGGTLACIGDLTKMDPEYVRGYTMKGYGVSLALGIAIPIPVTSASLLKQLALNNSEIYTNLVDYSEPRLKRTVLGQFNYEQLQSGEIDVKGKSVRTSPLSSMRLARKQEASLRKQLKSGEFLLTERVEAFPMDKAVKPFQKAIK